MVPIQIVSDAEAEQCDFAVCALKSPQLEAMWPDNVEAVCCDCHRAIVHRPNAPKAPPKICAECMVRRVP